MNRFLFQFDEVIPDELDTQHGGFYINFGDLMFKKVEFSDRFVFYLFVCFLFFVCFFFARRLLVNGYIDHAVNKG